MHNRLVFRSTTSGAKDHSHLYLHLHLEIISVLNKKTFNTTNSKLTSKWKNPINNYIHTYTDSLFYVTNYHIPLLPAHVDGHLRGCANMISMLTGCEN